MNGRLSIVEVRWPKACRIIRSIHPPIDLFEDIADPQDWEALASVEAKTNPRIVESMGRLDLVPPERRVAGPGASLVIASACALVAAALTVASLVILPAIWRGGRRVDSWTQLRKAAFSLTVLVYTAFSVVLGLWGALSPWSG